MAQEVKGFPVIEFHDINGVVHRIKEIKEDKNFDGVRRVTYTTYENETFHFLIREK